MQEKKKLIKLIDILIEKNIKSKRIDISKNEWIIYNPEVYEQNYKTNESDVINVEVKGVISTKKDSVILWENKIDIVEIISVTASKETNNTLKLGTK